MLPVVDKPIIQYGVEEAVQSGIENIIIVTGRGKTAIEDHFDVSFEMENLLETRKKNDLLKIVRGIADLVDVSYIRQKEALGLGHAVMRASALVGNEPFVVVLADDVIDAQTPCIRQLLNVHEKYDAPVIAVMEVPEDKTSFYGVVDAEPVGDNVFRIRDLVEKPKKGEAPSNLAIIGRYVLTPDIFDSIGKIAPGAGSEIQLTDAIRHLLRTRPIYACKFEGKRYDAGDKLGFLMATVELGLRNPELGPAFREYLKALKI